MTWNADDADLNGFFFDKGAIILRERISSKLSIHFDDEKIRLNPRVATQISVIRVPYQRLANSIKQKRELKVLFSIYSKLNYSFSTSTRSSILSPVSPTATISGLEAFSALNLSNCSKSPSSPLKYGKTSIIGDSEIAGMV